MAFIFTCQAIFLQTTVLRELRLMALSSTEISSVLFGLSPHGLHESFLTFTVCNYYENINQGQNSKDSLGFNSLSDSFLLKWRQHSLTARMMSGFLLESASVCNFGWHGTCLWHTVLPAAGTAPLRWQGGATFCCWFGHKFYGPNDDWKVRLHRLSPTNATTVFIRRQCCFYLVSHWKVILEHVWALTPFLNIFSPYPFVYTTRSR